MAPPSPKRPFPRNIFTNLSKLECEYFLEVAHCTMHAEDPEDVREALMLFQNYFSFTKSLGGLVHLGKDGAFSGFNNVINASYPDEWLYRYWKNGFADVDPVFKSALHASGTQHWQAIYQHQPLPSEKEQAFLDAAHQFGLCDGITTGSVDHACGLATFCSFASEHALDGGRLLPLVEYFGYYIHMALLRVTPHSTPKMDRCINELSSREVTILNWMKNGKTNWEIGKILGVSERTIRFHIESIFTKLEVTSRSQAVATAMEHGLPALHGLPSTG
ncbi:MAG: LuxR C-terminal-related transcriptional regulator [Nitrospira sp.]|nr:LuxR C-terminal-related transcriptional regulator [Nitrospira sp.]